MPSGMTGNNIRVRHLERGPYGGGFCQRFHLFQQTLFMDISPVSDSFNTSSIDGIGIIDVAPSPADARFNLVDRILESLNLSSRPEIDRLWAEEAERRVAQIDNGEVDLIPIEKVFAKIRRMYPRTW
jgi:putative addiction module component (TIGR02574 family)